MDHVQTDPADQQTLRVWQADEAGDDQDFIEAVSDSWGPPTSSSP